jgi:predicted amidohydrolase
MEPWKIAGVQMNCRLADKAHNLQLMQVKLREAAGQGSRLVIFPECALTGYSFESAEEAWPHTEPIPGPSTEILDVLCKKLGVWAVIGMLERHEKEHKFFNACAMVGPEGMAVSYRKVHLPCLGVDRFSTPGDRPFAVHDLGGLRVGMTICYDASFPEASRVLALLGADLVVLPTNWPTGARSTAKYLVQARALENHIYYAAVNRVGEEGGFHFIGLSRIVDCNGDLLASSDSDSEALLYAVLDPGRARNKQIVHIPGRYEINRVADRRPEMYRPLCERADHRQK